MVETVTTDKRTLFSLLESLLGWSDANKVLLTSVTYLTFEVCLLVGFPGLLGRQGCVRAKRERGGDSLVELLLECVRYGHS